MQVGDAIPALVKNPTTRQLVKYAGASGDYYEIHYDHHFAVKSGLKDGVIVHGLLTAGWLAQLMTDWLPSPLALKKFGVSYRAMARAGDTITCTGTIVSKYEKDGLHLVDCESRPRTSGARNAPSATPPRRCRHEPEGARIGMRRDGQRCAMGVKVRPCGPTYTDCGRMRRLSANCSNTCAVQPAVRPTAKVGVKSSAGMLTACRMSAA